MALDDPPTGNLSTDPKVYLWRAGMVIITLIILIVQLWSAVNYVPRSEYERDKQRHTLEQEDNNKTLLLINNTLIRIDEKMKGDETRDKEIADHEKRIRELERMMYGKSP